MNPKRLKIVRAVALGVLVAAGALVAIPASAQTWGDLLGDLIKQGMIDNAVKKWNAVDPDVRQCLANSYGLNAGDVAQEGITPDDYRLQNQMQSCQQAVAQARQAAAAREAASRSWNAVDPDVLQCLTDRYSFVPAQLVEQGIGADDPQVANQTIACRQSITEAREQAAERQRAVVAEREAEEKAAKARAEAHHNNLVARFGKEEADAIENGRVTVGMSKDAVREALGPPNNVESIPPNDEMWVYGSERISISSGKVTYVGH